MFVNEITPLVREFIHQPVAFLGGFFTGALRLNLNDDPVRSWLDKQMGSPGTNPAGASDDQNGKNQGPKTISIE
jgi:hypothetical protein